MQLAEAVTVLQNRLFSVVTRLRSPADDHRHNAANVREVRLRLIPAGAAGTATLVTVCYKQLQVPLLKVCCIVVPCCIVRCYKATNNCGYRVC
jgi:hypothetical protein